MAANISQWLGKTNNYGINTMLECHLYADEPKSHKMTSACPKPCSRSKIPINYDQIFCTFPSIAVPFRDD